MRLLLRPAVVFGLLIALATGAAAMAGVAHVWPRVKASLQRRQAQVPGAQVALPPERSSDPPAPALPRERVTVPSLPIKRGLPPVSQRVAKLENDLPASSETVRALLDDPGMHAPDRSSQPAPATVVAPAAVAPPRPPETKSVAAPSTPTEEAKSVAAPSTPTEEAKSVAAPSTPTEEAILVLQATHALHEERDPRRAIELLERYMRCYPSGDLLEESMALLIEAWATRNDAGP